MHQAIVQSLMGVLKHVCPCVPSNEARKPRKCPEMNIWINKKWHSHKGVFAEMLVTMWTSLGNTLSERVQVTGGGTPATAL